RYADGLARKPYPCPQPRRPSARSHRRAGSATPKPALARTESLRRGVCKRQGCLHFYDLSTLRPDRLESAGFVGHIPGEVEVVGGPDGARRRRRIMAVAALHAVSRERVALDPYRSAIEKQLDAIAIGVASDRQGHTLAPLPVPVREEVQHRLLAPLAL